MRDTLERRIRFAQPQPSGKGVILKDSDFKIFEALHRHGPLPTHYLFAFSGRKDFNSFQNRLTSLYNDGGYLIRPPEYFESIFARYQSIVYDLSDKALTLLEERGALSPFIKRRDHAIHRLMTACVVASIELSCKDGVRFIPRHEILQEQGNPMRLPLSSGYLEPDEVFGLHFTVEKQKHYYMVEIDRGTEQLQSAISRETLTQKFQNYAEVFEAKTYKEIWGRGNMELLLVTTSQPRADNVRSGVMVKGKRYDVIPNTLQKKVHMALAPHFASPWEMPPIYGHLHDALNKPRIS